MEEFSYVAKQNTVWNCVKCGCNITSEPGQAYDERGKIIQIFTPASRYWLPGSKPHLTKGVFCRPECAANNVIQSVQTESKVLKDDNFIYNTEGEVLTL